MAVSATSALASKRRRTSPSKCNLFAAELSKTDMLQANEFGNKPTTSKGETKRELFYTALSIAFVVVFFPFSVVLVQAKQNGWK